MLKQVFYVYGIFFLSVFIWTKFRYNYQSDTAIILVEIFGISCIQFIVIYNLRNRYRWEKNNKYLKKINYDKLPSSFLNFYNNVEELIQTNFGEFRKRIKSLNRKDMTLSCLILFLIVLYLMRYIFIEKPFFYDWLDFILFCGIMITFFLKMCIKNKISRMKRSIICKESKKVFQVMEREVNGIRF